MRHRWLLFPLLLPLLFLLFLVLRKEGALRPVQAAPIPAVKPLLTADTPPLTAAEPLPGGCRNITPPGGTEPVCCISGYVYLDGAPVSGAKVTIQSRTGSIVLDTKSYIDIGNLPIYRVALSVPPLNVEIGTPITVTASYAGITQTRTHIIQSRGQQLDIVLPRPQASYQFVGEGVWRQLTPGQLVGPSDIAIDSAGNQYVVDTENARIQIFNAAGQNIYEIGRLGKEPWQFIKPSGITLDANRQKLYVADTGNHRIQVFDVQNLENITFWKEWGTQGTGNGEFNYPRDVAIDSQFVYVTDMGNNRVQKFTLEGVYQASWGGFGEATSTDPQNGKFDRPVGIATYNNIIFVADSNNNRIQKFTNVGDHLQNFGGPAANATALQFDSPEQIVIDPAGFIYVTEHWNSRIQKLNSEGVLQWVRGTGGSEAEQFRFYSNIFANNYQFHHGITIDMAGIVHVVDSGNGRIQRLDGNGIFQLPQLHHGDIITKVQNISAFTLDIAGNSYILDSLFKRVNAFRANSGTPIWNGWALPMNSYYTDIAADSMGFLYLVNRTEHTIQQFTTSGAHTTIGGGYGITAGQFMTPTSIVVDSQDNLYVTDTGNKRIQKFTKTQNQWSTVSITETLWGPLTIAINRHNQLYVVDWDSATDEYRVLAFNSAGVRIKEWRKVFPYPPLKIAADDNGYLYVSSSANENGHWISYIYRYDPNDTIVPIWMPETRWKLDTMVKHIEIDQPRRQIIVGTDHSSMLTYELPTFTKPIATIRHRSNEGTIESNRIIVIEGMGQDSDTAFGGMTVGYEWRLDGNLLPGQTSSKLEVPASTLPLGEHTISFAFRDDEGAWSTPVQTTLQVAPATTPNSEWTFLLYLDADHNDAGLLQSAFTRTIANLREAASSNSLKTNIAIQLDGPADGDTRRLLIAKNGAITEENMSEQPMDSPQTLTNFIKWGQERFPNTYYYLAVADHGQGILGINWDYTSDHSDGPVDFSAYLSVKELAHALSDPAVKKIHVLHLDACSMALLEVAYELRGVADILIASQYLAWSYFGYDDYAAQVNATTTATELATRVIETYAVNLQGYPHTIAAVDLAHVESATNRLNKLAAILLPLTEDTQSKLKAIRADVQTLISDPSNRRFENDRYAIYVDLKDWVNHIKASELPGDDEADALLAELNQLVIANKNASKPGVKLENAQGISLIYPYERTALPINQFLGTEHFDFALTANHWLDVINRLQPLAPGESMTETEVNPLAPQQWETRTSNLITVYLPVIVVNQSAPE